MFPMTSSTRLAPKLLTSAKESFGVRLAQLRKERGFTQVELAQKIGSIQAIISDYERAKTRPTAEVLIQLALALEVSSDVLLGLPQPKLSATAQAPNRRILRRVLLIEQLPKRDQDALLRTIDAFLAKSA
jgi:transcriptional regulator with XRE-family HTH domain